MQPLTAEERQQFYHLTEGSEVFPLQWLKALESTRTHRPFLEHMDRFGLINDATNELPIGISSSTARDVHFGSSPLMVGVTCAACHTGEFTYKGARFVIDGAPSKFDLHAYYQDLFESATSLRDIQSFLQFYWRLSGEPAPPGMQAHGAPARFPWAQATTLPSTRHMVESVDSDALLQSNNQFDQRALMTLTQQLEEDRRVFDKNPKTFVGSAKIVPLWSEAEAAPGSVQPELSLDEEKKISTERLMDSGLRASKTLDKVRTQLNQASADSVLNNIAPTREERSTRLGLGFDDIRTQFRLLLARAEFLKTLSNLPDMPTPAGFGRLDAFGNARDLLWPQYPVPITAPVSYPALWNFRDEEYVHWDADTTSVIERNIGQALGLGAVLDRRTAMSTVNPRNLHNLELLAGKFTPPKWPEAVFGPIDRAEAAKGSALFNIHCAECHSFSTGTQVLKSPKEVGTDRMRADNFAVPVGGVGFDVSIQTMMERIKAQAYKDNNVTPEETVAFDGEQPPPGQPKWRITHKYVAGTLRGMWATSPYLHNGSVLNLYERI